MTSIEAIRQQLQGTQDCANHIHGSMQHVINEAGAIVSQLEALGTNNPEIKSAIRCAVQVVEKQLEAHQALKAAMGHVETYSGQL